MTEKPDLTRPEAAEEDGKLAEWEVLRVALEASKAKAAEYYDQLLRLKAEFDNFRKRVDREKAEARAWGKQEVLLQLVSLVDVFEQALIQAHKAKDTKHVLQGIEMLHKNFAQFLKTEGLEPIESVGKPLDPLKAEAVEQEEVDEDQVGLVLSDLQKGYVFQGRVLRPSRVRVGVAKKENTKDKKEKEDEKEEDDAEDQDE